MVYQIPPFLMGQAANVDFSPIQNALAQWRQGQQQNVQNALARENLNWHRENALSQRQMDQKKLDWEMSKFDQTQEGIGELRKAQAAQALAHAGLFRAQSQFRYADPPAAVRQPTIGQREDGSLYEMDAGEGTVDIGEPRVERRVLGDSSSMKPGISRGVFVPNSDNGTVEPGAPLMRGGEHRLFGEYGKSTLEVPGIIINKGLATDKPATWAYHGQRAVEAMPDGDRERFLKGQKNQQLWSMYYGRPPSAKHMYDQQGREVPVGPLSGTAEQREGRDRAISNMLRQIDEAEKTLIGEKRPDGSRSGGSYALTRAVAGGLQDGPFGRFTNNLLGLEPVAEALGKYKEGVLQTVYALSGKQTTNKEMEAFLNLYMPQSGESEKYIEGKGLRLRRMLQTLQTKLNKGMVYDQAEREALAEATNADFNKNQERLAPSNPTVQKYKNKYQGLE